MMFCARGGRAKAVNSLKSHSKHGKKHDSCFDKHHSPITEQMRCSEQRGRHLGK